MLTKAIINMIGYKDQSLQSDGPAGNLPSCLLLVLNHMFSMFLAPAEKSNIIVLSAVLDEIIHHRGIELNSCESSTEQFKHYFQLLVNGKNRNQSIN